MEQYLVHYGIKGQKVGVRRYQNEDGSYTALGKSRYGIGLSSRNKKISTDLSKNLYRRGSGLNSNPVGHNNAGVANLFKYEKAEAFQKSAKSYARQEALKSKGKTITTDIIATLSGKNKNSIINEKKALRNNRR